MKRKAHIILLVLLLLCVLSTTAFAIDESEVESAIAASSKEEVAGNVFIWFLCAIGFLKVSQKIDSFMASLGINVGRTGGSMLTELMVAGRGIAAVAGAVGGTVFNHHSSSNSTHTNAQAAGAAFTGGGNGLVGVTRRAAGNAAAASATGNAKGLSNLVGGAMFESSLQNGGKFAMSVVGAVAKGSIAATATSAVPSICAGHSAPSTPARRRSRKRTRPAAGRSGWRTSTRRSSFFRSSASSRPSTSSKRFCSINRSFAPERKRKHGRQEDRC